MITKGRKEIMKVNISVAVYVFMTDNFKRKHFFKGFPIFFCTDSV